MTANARATVLRAGLAMIAIAVSGCSKEPTKDQANPVVQPQPGANDDNGDRPEETKPEPVKLQRDPNLELALAAEREKKRAAIAKLEKQFTAKLATLPRASPKDKYVAHLSSNKNWPRISAAFAPNGKLLAIGGPEPYTDIWDLESARRLRTLNAEGWGSLVFSQDSRTLATLGKGISTTRFQLWDVQTGNLKFEREHGWPSICDVHFTSDGKTVLSVGRQLRRRGTRRRHDQILEPRERKAGK